MSVPYNNDTRESYVQRMAENHIAVAKRHHELGQDRSMWIQLFTWAMCEDIYGEHWDTLIFERNER